MPPKREAPAAAPKRFPAWMKTVAEVAQYFEVDLAKGLSKSDVEAKRRVYGFNELDKEEGTPLWKLILEQFDDPLVKILLLAAAVSFGISYFEESEEEKGVGHFIEPMVIVLILVLNATVGVWMESNAENALEALKEMQSEHAKVLRGGKLESELPARELVPGDVVELRVGDKIPADMRLAKLKTATLKIEQASLTGEAVSVMKRLDPVLDEGCELQAKECMLFASTTISSGQAVGIVTDIGMQTEIGKIQASITQAKDEEEDTPLKKKLDEFGEMLTNVISFICIVVWLTNYKSFLNWENQKGSEWIPDFSTVSFNFVKCTYYFKIAVALAVAAIPEGLPAVITTCLALGTRKMAKKNAIVRKLASVETLGCTTVICSDKTGTLTTNQMSATKVVLLGAAAPAAERDLRVFEVTGSTYSVEEGSIVGLPAQLDVSVRTLAEVCALCNESRVEYHPAKQAYACVGEPTEAALRVLVEKMGAASDKENAAIQEGRASDKARFAEGACQSYAAKLQKAALLEFDRDRKSMSVIVSAPRAAGGRARNRLLVKGASENVLGRCGKMVLANGDVVPITAAAREAILNQITAMANKALRVIGFAVKEAEELGELADYDGEGHRAHKLLMEPSNYLAIESDLTFVGLVGLRDPPRPEVRDAVEECRKAGIRVIVITGDNKNTAEAICQEIGVFRRGEDIRTRSLTGRDFAALPVQQQVDFLMHHSGGRVFSRAEPKHKQDIVRLLKDHGEIVAMTGDGVNDAPALKLANIGVAMGITGTEVAKEASDMVLADDNFSTIVSAVAEGRAIYMNMKAFIRYMISSNMGEVASIFLTAAFGLPEGMVPVQLLWVNLVTDGPPATALGFNPPDLDIMSKPPRRADDALITPWVMFRYAVVGLYVGAATVGAFVVWFTQHEFLGIDLSKDGHTTVTFKQLTHWHDCEHWSGFKAAPWTDVYGTVHSFDKPCEYFDLVGKSKASTLSLTVLVAIEMFNALNALSEDGSLVSMPPWVNPYLLVAMSFSIGVHCLVLYVPVLSAVFGVVPLSLEEWALVLALSAPVVLIDEVLKFFGRRFAAADTVRRMKELQHDD